MTGEGADRERPPSSSRYTRYFRRFTLLPFVSHLVTRLLRHLVSRTESNGM